MIIEDVEFKGPPFALHFTHLSLTTRENVEAGLVLISTGTAESSVVSQRLLK